MSLCMAKNPPADIKTCLDHHPAPTNGGLNHTWVCTRDLGHKGPHGSGPDREWPNNGKPPRKAS